MPKQLVELKVIHQKILRALAFCEFLTIPHFVRLNVCSEPYLRRKLRELQRKRPKPLIGCLQYGVRGGGKRPSYYYLTAYGRVRAAKAGVPLERIKAPGKNPQIETDYQHRTQQIDFLVNLLLRATAQGVQLNFFDHYFDRTKGSNRIQELTSQTRIQLPDGIHPHYIEPDAAFAINTPIGEKLYLFELHRGADAKRLIRQLHVHRIVIREGLAMQKYAFARNNRVVVLCERKNTQAAALRQLQTDPAFADFYNYFVFKNLEETEFLRPSAFYHGWVNLRGEKVGIY